MQRAGCRKQERGRVKGSGWPPHEPDAGHGVGEGSLLGRVGGHIALAQSDDLIGAGLVGDTQVGEVAGDLSGGWGAAWSDVASSLAKAGTKQTHGLELFGEGCIGLIIAGQDGFVLFGEAPVQRRQLRPVLQAGIAGAIARSVDAAGNFVDELVVEAVE
jgi:hypothetical protein